MLRLADPTAALTKLKEGNARFASSITSAGKPVAAKRAEFAEGQHPLLSFSGRATQ